MAQRLICTAAENLTGRPFSFRRCRSLPTIRDDDKTYHVPDEESFAEWFSGPSTTTDLRLCRPFLVLMLLLLCCFIEELTMPVITSISLLVSVYLFSRIISLSEKTTGTLQAIVRVSYVPLLAFFIGNSWKPFAGTVVMYLNTIVAAGQCGYTLANHRRRMGTENSVEIAILCLPVYLKERKERGQKEPNLAPVAFLLCLASLGFAVWTVWMFCTYGPTDVVDAVMDLSIWLAMGLFPWTWFVDGCLMEWAIFSSYTFQMLFITYIMFFGTSFTVFLIIFGDSGVAIITWLIAMANAGLFGYTVAVYHQFNSRRVSQKGQAYHWLMKVVTHCLGLPTEKSSPYNSRA